MAGKLVTIFGGSGFVGRHMVRVLAKAGWRVRVAVRRPDLAGHLQPLGTVGQISAVQANLRYPDSVLRAVQGADAVINLVGILHESGRQTFRALQADGARIVAQACKHAGVGQLIQMSAIGADADMDADYARSKAAGEAAVLAAFPKAIILRPSLVFGPEDQFFNRFAAMARFAPALPLIGGGTTKFQPVYVGDVAKAAAVLLDGCGKPGATYELGGPDVADFAELMRFILATTGRSRPLVPLPFPVAKIMGRVMEMLPAPQLTSDQVTMLERDNVVSAEAIAEGRTLAGLGITPQAYASIVPGYLYRFRKHGQFERVDQAKI